MGLLGIDVYIIRIFEYIRISYANIRIPISAFVDIPKKKTHTKTVLRRRKGNNILPFL